MKIGFCKNYLQQRVQTQFINTIRFSLLHGPISSSCQGLWQFGQGCFLSQKIPLQEPKAPSLPFFWRRDGSIGEFLFIWKTTSAQDPENIGVIQYKLGAVVRWNSTTRQNPLILYPPLYMAIIFKP